MTSSSRVVYLIQRHFLTQWPLVSGDVPCAVDGPPSAGDYDNFARLSVWISRVDRLGWIYVAMWVRAENHLVNSAMLTECAHRVFADTRITSDDGEIVVDQGRRHDVGLDGDHWVFATQFSLLLSH